MKPTAARRSSPSAAMFAVAGRARCLPGEIVSEKRAALSFRLGLAVLIAVYAVLYGAMLVATDFVPYVLDNNESFSNLNHARNLIEFGAAKSFGLADEAVSPHRARSCVSIDSRGRKRRVA